MPDEARTRAHHKSFAEKVKQLADVMDETRLIMTILTFARSGHATDLMVEQAIALVDGHVAVARSEADDGLLKTALDLKAGLEEALKNGVKSLRETRGPSDEMLKVEMPLAQARRALGHDVRRQHRCSCGIVDIIDLTANELIECKIRGSSAALGEAAGQLRRYAKSFPGAGLTIAVPSIDPDANWLADVLGREGMVIIEVEPTKLG
jgi:hypothetical protein